MVFIFKLSPCSILLTAQLEQLEHTVHIEAQSALSGLYMTTKELYKDIHIDTHMKITRNSTQEQFDLSILFR